MIFPSFLTSKMPGHPWPRENSSRAPTGPYPPVSHQECDRLRARALGKELENWVLVPILLLVVPEAVPIFSACKRV